MSVEEITKAVEKVNLAYELPETLKVEVLKQDSKVFELLRLLDEYEKLANDLFRVHFANGFLELSRANYNGSKKHGLDSFDLRPYKACSILGTDGEIVDRLSEQRERDKRKKEKEKREKELEMQKQEKEKEVEKDDKVDENVEGKSKAKGSKKATSVRTVHGTGELRNRKYKKETPADHEIYKDPLNQFGGLVPYQLRHSQTLFKQALVDCVKMVRLQQKMQSLIDEIGQV